MYVLIWSGSVRRFHCNKLLRWQVLQTLDQLGSPQPESVSASVMVVSTCMYHKCSCTITICRSETMHVTLSARPSIFFACNIEIKGGIGDEVTKFTADLLWCSHKLHPPPPYTLYQEKNNKEGKRVSNALYTPCNMFLTSNVTCSRVYMTSPRG